MVAQIGQFDIEVAEPAIEMGTALFSGMGQRVAWEVSTPLGFITTGGLTIGGLLGSFFLTGLGKAAAMGLANSGIALVGWLSTEQFLLTPGGRGGSVADKVMNRVDVGAGDRERLPAGARVNGMAPSALEIGLGVSR